MRKASSNGDKHVWAGGLSLSKRSLPLSALAALCPVSSLHPIALSLSKVCCVRQGRLICQRLLMPLAGLARQEN
ncbi:MAG: hypothetical protein JWP29_4120 [Rhodoferax sp.]|nr:hypothetical protein [Rhodoferax sp.]